MDITLYISRFLYRLRYKILIGSILVAAIVAYFTQFLPQSYTVSTQIYTGIASSSGLDEDKLSFFELNNTFDNLINLTKAKGTLEKVSLRLFAMNMMHGSTESDGMYITAKNYKHLLEITPKEVKDLIVKDSEEKTLENIYNYNQEIPGNFFFSLFNGSSSHYSYNALKTVMVKRLNSSDVIEISYKSDDPGIAMNTVKLITDELVNSYDGIRYKAANDVVAYYEQQLKIHRKKLDALENDLTDYNVENKVINYVEQTKAIAISFTNYEDRYEEVTRVFESSTKLIEKMEDQMRARVQLIKSNTDFIDALDKLSTINSKITEIETFNATDAGDENPELVEYKNSLKEEEKRISRISDEMNENKYSKEGIATDDIVNKWLDEVIKNTKAKAELKVLNERKEAFAEQYRTYSPIGAEINRREREIRVTEESYLEILHGLNLAKLKQKNIQLTSATLNVIAAPVFPINSDGSKRALLVIAAFIGSIVFIIGCYLIIELLDRTLRDADRTKRLTGETVKCAFVGHRQLKYRGYGKAGNRMAAAYACSQFTQLLRKDRPIYVNILSIEEGEGKSFIAGYIKERWEEDGLRVTMLENQADFKLDTNYLLAENFGTLCKGGDHPDIILIEHPAVQLNSLAVNLLSKADVNVVVANAARVWKKSDDTFMEFIKDKSQDVPVWLFLNNTSRDAVEDFTGQLPPKTSMRTFSNRIMYMGLTSGESAVK